MATADCAATTANEAEGAATANWDDDTAAAAAAADWGVFIIEMDCVESGSNTTETTSSLAHRAICG